MRQLFTLIVLAALGYFGYKYYQEHGLTLPSAESEESPSSTLPESSVPATPAPPTFKSRIPLPETARPGDKLVAPPGVYYMTERVSAQTNSGIVAVLPGEAVRLLKRTGNTLKITHGGTEFDVKESQVTNDLNVAREFEKKEFQRRTGQR